MDRQIIPSAATGPGHGAGMVPGIKAGGFIFFSAVRGRGPNGFSDDTKEQTRAALDSLKDMLAASGATLEHVVKVTLYLHDLKYRSAFHEVWMEYFPKDPPARLAMQVADANAQPGQGAQFVLDVIPLA